MSDGYDAADNGKRCYDEGIAAMRAKHLGVERVVHIGNHELILGDCLEVMPKLGKFDAVVTDPPYGMVFRSNHRTIRTKHRAIAGDHNTALLQWACELPVNHSRYVWMRWDCLLSIPKPKSMITWIKNNHSMGDLEGEHARKTEVCAFYPGDNHRFPSGRPCDVLYAARTQNEHHPTQKPVDLIAQQLHWTVGSVCDPFMGSGTTGVACEQLGRHFTGIELDPEYFEIAVKRVREAYAQPTLFEAEPKPKPPENGNLFTD